MDKKFRWFVIVLGAPIALMISFLGIQAAPAASRSKLPKQLSETGIFRDLSTLEPGAGVVPYDINVPSWSDGAQTRRWIILPGNGSSTDPAKDRIIVKPGLPWAFPEGSVFVTHFDWMTDRSAPSRLRRIETRVLVRDKDGGVYGFTYRWNADGRDARLIEQEETEVLSVRRADGSDAQQRYDYPTPDQCVVCHNEAAGGVLGINYRQLNRPIRYADGQAPVNQVIAWNRASMLSKSLDEPKALDRWNLTWIPPSLPVPFWSVARSGRLTPLQDGASSVETRARAYLDANCSSCHAPGIANADWDARSSTPLDEQHLIDAHPRVPRAGTTAIVKPGVPEESLLYLRVSSLDPALKMPPLGRNAIDEEGARLLADWIRSLPKQSRRR
jgi:uncharacterized repeat protein (TIGR03806 family)